VATRQAWTIDCDGSNLHRPETDVSCGSWVGREESKFAARALARECGWVKTGPDEWLCPRHARERKADAP
jgi:hypothetical protein